ncbi:MAG: MjaI family restriction endonuclease, partial [Geopsychrobacter sp.]|nr:MjaI family restriction endonuclease [Geopsychrobacter sp.]
MYCPSQHEFQTLAQQGNLIPVYREILADMETPVSAFRKIDDGQTSFLLESIEGGEKWARYSFLGSGPARIFRCRDKYFEVVSGDQLECSGEAEDPLAKLQELLEAYRPVEVEGLPRFFGGAVGYLGYDMVRFVEDLPDKNQRDSDNWDACFLLTEGLLIFDNMRQKIKVVCNVRLAEGEDPHAAYARGVERIELLIDKLRYPLPHRIASRHEVPEQALTPNFTPEAFRQAVEDCKEYIYQVTIVRTFDGFLLEKSVVNDGLAKIFPEVEFEESDPELDHAGDIDYIGKIGD